MSITIRAAAARELAPTVEELTALLARTLARYGNVDATYEGGGRYDLITSPASSSPDMRDVRKEFLAAKRTTADTERRQAWLNGGDAADGDDLHQAAELVCDILCALSRLGADHAAVLNQVEDDFLDQG